MNPRENLYRAAIAFLILLMLGGLAWGVLDHRGDLREAETRMQLALQDQKAQQNTLPAEARKRLDSQEVQMLATMSVPLG